MNLSRVAPVLLMAALLLPRSSQAQELLRWKLKSGDQLRVATKQNVESQVAFSGKSAKTTIEIELSVDWLVTAADDAGFTIKQTIMRLASKMTAGPAPPTEYDSAAKTKPTGKARELAQSLDPIVGAEFELRMTDRGEITSARPLNDQAKALFHADGQPAETNQPSLAAVEKTLRQPLVVLPEKAVSVGDTWKHDRELTTTAGTFQQEMTYRLANSANGKQKIETTGKLVSKGAAASKTPAIQLKSSEQTGTVTFDSAKGRPTEAESQTTLVTERSYRDVTIVVNLKSEQRTTVKPVEQN